MDDFTNAFSWLISCLNCLENNTVKTSEMPSVYLEQYEYPWKLFYSTVDQGTPDIVKVTPDPFNLTLITTAMSMELPA